MGPKLIKNGILVKLNKGKKAKDFLIDFSIPKDHDSL
jgi:hypothetical protein